jgi:hypothetical protein
MTLFLRNILVYRQRVFFLCGLLGLSRSAYDFLFDCGILPCRFNTSSRLGYYYNSFLSSSCRQRRLRIDVGIRVRAPAHGGGVTSSSSHVHRAYNATSNLLALSMEVSISGLDSAAFAASSPYFYPWLGDAIWHNRRPSLLSSHRQNPVKSRYSIK